MMNTFTRGCMPIIMSLLASSSSSPWTNWSDTLVIMRRNTTRSRIPTACGSNNSWLPLLADALHNLTDGIAIASSFALSPGIGWKTTLAIFLHEIPHELGDYAVLAKAGVSHEQIIRVQLLTGAVAFVGSIFGYYFGKGIKGLNGMAAGGFVYLALAGIVPDVLQSKSMNVLGGFILGVLIMTLLD